MTRKNKNANELNSNELLAENDRLRAIIKKLRSAATPMRHLIKNHALCVALKGIVCPVCYARVPADRTYADGYRHLLDHLIPGGAK